jgi:hypothetical protein
MIQGKQKTKPNKAKRVKCCNMSEMHEKFIKQSQMIYPSNFQRVERILRPFFRKNECAQAKAATSRQATES